MSRLFLVASAVLGLLGVAGGAFGAHALRDILDAERLSIYETAIRYQLYHSFALAFAGWALRENQIQYFRHAGLLFLGGVALFSGSLYIVTFTGLRWLGAVAPLGGLAFLAGWFSLIFGYWKLK